MTKFPARNPQNPTKTTRRNVQQKNDNKVNVYIFENCKNRSPMGDHGFFLKP